MKCSKESSHKLHSLSSLGLTSASSAEASRKMRRRSLMIFAALVLACACGCSKTILVSESSPIRIGQVRGTVYASVNGEWRLSENAVTIPEGWYCVPPSFMDAIGNGDGTR